MTLARAWSNLPQISNLCASGDGEWAFWCWAGVTETEQVWAVALAGGVPVRLTDGDDHFLIRDVSQDGRRLILAQSRHASEHDHLFMLDRDQANQLIPLTPPQASHYVYGGIFGPDDTVIFTANYDYDADTVTSGGWVWSQHLITGTRRCLAQSDTPFEDGPRLSPDGKQLLWHRHDRAPAGTQIWVMNTDGQGLRAVLNLGPTNNSRGDWITDDQIAFASDHEGRDRLGLLTLSSGQITWLAGEPDLLPHQVVAGHGHFACVAHRDSVTHAVCGPALRPLPNLSGRRSLLPHAALPDGGWLAEAYDADAPHQVVRVLPDGTCLTLSGIEGSSRRHTRPQDFRWTVPDGSTCQGWLYRPSGPSRGFIAYIHGGPTWHSEDWVNPKIGFWVQSGFTVLDPNYRGSTGFGHDWREAVKQDGWGGAEQADIRAGIEACVNQGFAEHGKIAVAGNSYGGFSSWFAITRHADLVTAAIPMCGMYRLDIDYHATEMPHGRAYSEQMMGGTPEEYPQKYANASPGNFIERIRGHLMIVHGLADSNVGPENTHVALRELTAAGIPHEVLLFDDEGHGVFRRSNVETYLTRSAAFLERAFAAGAQ